MYSFPELLDKVNNRLDSIPHSKAPQNLYAPIRYILEIGGKRVRPVLMLMGYNLWKEDVNNIIDQAVALETYHNFTLLHDDLMDKSDIRRGNPTVHKKWDDNTAILSGDAMLILAYKIFGQNAATKDFIDATLGVCEGQQYDMEFESRNDVLENEYMEMIRLKTSLLLGYALKIGAILAGANPKDAQLMYDFGEKMGLAFQIQDDMLDVYGDTRHFKKKLGADIVDNKKTYLLIKALETANVEQKANLTYWLKNNDCDDETKISSVKAIYDELNIRSLAQEKIEQLFALSHESLSAVDVAEERKEILYDFCQKLLGRKY